MGPRAPMAMLHMNEKGRTVIPAAIRAAADISTDDELVARVAGPGVVVLESRAAIRARIRANVGQGGVDLVASLRADRTADVDLDERRGPRPRHDDSESEAIGKAMLAELGL